MKAPGVSKAPCAGSAGAGTGGGGGEVVIGQHPAKVKTNKAANTKRYFFCGTLITPLQV